MTGTRDSRLRKRCQARNEDVRLTLHAHQEMLDEGIALDEVLQALCSAEVLEDYPEHRRGACCLALGFTEAGRPLHVVCTTAQPTLIIITVYEPRAPKWVAPTKRGGRHDAV